MAMSSRGSKKPLSALNVKLTIRSGGVEVSTEGTLSELSEELDSLSNFVEEVASKLGVESGIEVSTEAQKIINDSSEVPTIKVTKSSTDNLRSLFNTSWGRKPRVLAEILNALEVNAVPDTPQNVNVYLVRLVKQGFLRRIQKGTKWSYYRIPET